MKGGNLKKLLTAILLTALTVFSVGCASRGAALRTTAELDAAVEALEHLPPPEPDEEAVVFDDRDGGLWLSYENYRALERNVIALREYAARLLLIAEYYREER
jgi:hypothetical protein